VEQRKAKRFIIQLPLAVMRAGSQWAPGQGCTQNISSGGVLFTAEKEPDLGDPIEYVITLNGAGHKAVNIRCVGKIVRYERENREAGHFQVAATLERYEFLRDRK
jgi:hypothetical protein